MTQRVYCYANCLQLILTELCAVPIRNVCTNTEKIWFKSLHIPSVYLIFRREEDGIQNILLDSRWLSDEAHCWVDSLSEQSLVVVMNKL